MSLTEIHIHHLRNLSAVRLTLHPHINVFYGANGSGKTSLLEAIYLLSTGHSFRTREISPLVSDGQPSLTVFARSMAEGSISIQKSISGPTLVKLNNEPCYSSSELARFLPCQVFYQDIFQIIDAGPSVRRSLLDWGLFHVKQSYHLLWKDYRRVLKQRNALLRQKANQQQCAPWDTMLVSLANELDSMRTAYFSSWIQSFQAILPKLTDIPCSVQYYKGWDRKGSGKDLLTILNEQFTLDTQRQYTMYGPHHADILFESTLLKAKQTLSRGQQKIILIALKLAQSQLLIKPCTYLFDDMTAELDIHHLGRLMDYISQIKGQFFLTTIDPDQLQLCADPAGLAVFALERGRLQNVSRET